MTLLTYWRYGVPSMQPVVSPQVSPPSSPSVASTSTLKYSSSSGTCVIIDQHPDGRCSPGEVFATTTLTQICTSGYTQTVRNVSTAEKDNIYSEYGIAVHTPGSFEVDHLISLELGGSNDPKNLWPEAYTGPDNAHQKDTVENYLHREVCAGRMRLTDVQEGIAKDWKVYLKAAEAQP